MMHTSVVQGSRPRAPDSVLPPDAGGGTVTQQDLAGETQFGLRSADLWGLGFAAVASSAFALWTVLTKVAFRYGATVTMLTLSRFIIGAASMMVVCRVLRLPLWADRRLTFRLMGLGTTFVLSAVSLNLAIARIPAGATSLLLCTYRRSSPASTSHWVANGGVASRASCWRAAWLERCWCSGRRTGK